MRGTCDVSSGMGDTLKTRPVLRVGFRTERFTHSIHESVRFPILTCTYIHDRIAEFDYRPQGKRTIGRPKKRWREQLQLLRRNGRKGPIIDVYDDDDSGIQWYLNARDLSNGAAPIWKQLWKSRNNDWGKGFLYRFRSSLTLWRILVSAKTRYIGDAHFAGKATCVFVNISIIILCFLDRASSW